MPRVIGIFHDQPAADEVIDQLALNGIDRTTMVRAQELHTLHLPEQQAAEYPARLEQNQCLLLIEVSALDLPTVQRVLRNGHSVDIDLLPETSL